MHTEGRKSEYIKKTKTQIDETSSSSKWDYASVSYSESERKYRGSKK